MKLKRLEIQGFKSFDDRTVINFDSNFTGIVGPNGCGKSNVVDAIRWVMGEQSAKHLRGRSMEDIIFSGTQNRAPNSLSSVELTFSTAGVQTPVQYEGMEEISVGRKLYRTGESEYYINKQPSRLKDITDLFLGTGVGTKAYSIIEQGQIGLIINAKPEDRRHLIEEAAGISKFKNRKDAALRRMAATQQNLDRLRDILGELERQMATLDRQAKKAKRFKVIKDELTEIDLKVSSLAYKNQAEKQKEVLENIKNLDGEEQQASAEMATWETEVEDQRLQLTEVESRLNDLQQDVYEWDNRLKLAENKAHSKEEQNQNTLQEITTLAEQIENLKSDLLTCQKALSENNKNLVVAELEFMAADEVVNSLQGDHSDLQESSQKLFSDLEEKRAEHVRIEKEFSSLKSRQENVVSKLEELQEKKSSDETELEELTKRFKELEKLLKNTEKDLSGVRQLKFSLSEKTESLSQDLQNYEEKIRVEQTNLTETKEKLLQRKSRLQSLEELERNFEGYQEGPQQILRKKTSGELEGVLGSVADVIETDPKYENAVSAVLGERMQYVVVQSQAAGLSCSEFVKATETGRTSFVPVDLSFASSDNTVSARVVSKSVVTSFKEGDYNIPSENYAGSPIIFSASNDNRVELTTNHNEALCGRLLEHVSVKPGYENLANVLLDDVYLADDLPKALEAWNQIRKVIVTLEGDTISAEGVLTTGSLENTSKALLEKKREIKTLTQVVRELVDQVKAKEEICFDLNRKVKALKAELEDVKASQHEEDVRLAQQEKDFLHYSKETENLNSRRGKLSQAIFQATEVIDSLEKEQEELVQKLEQIEVDFSEIDQVVTDLKSKEQEVREQVLNSQEQLTKEKIRLAQSTEQKSFLQKEVERLLDQSLLLKEQIIQKEEQKTLLIKKRLFQKTRLAVLRKDIALKLEEKANLDQHYVEQKNVFEELQAKVSEKEQALKQKRQRYNKVKDELNQNTVSLTELRAHLSRINEQVLERYQMVLSEVWEQYLPNEEEEFDLASSEELASELRVKLGNIGNVNLAAIEELEELTERFEFLDKQRQDLEDSLNSLDKAIQKINRTTRERFKEAFEAINDKFTKLFPRLFRGGSAYLQLTDPENLLETGVEIIAQPPGKKLQSISLLSGGEKALTAISLLFSIFLIKPSPFCLLDEVDAPLDDANVGRYNDIVKEMSQRTQFVVITHNKQTMQEMDCLFGVTMQEPGVSQLVSVKMD